MINNHKLAVIGHRGANIIAPENTMLSFQKAIDLGADYIEFDVHLSSDSHIVVIHDKNTYRTTSVKGKVKKMSLNKLKQLDAGEGEKIPSLDDVIEMTKEKIKLQLEIKAQGMAHHVAKALKSAGIVDSTLISSFFYNELLEIHQLEPRLKLAPLVLGIKKKKIINKISKNGFYAVHPYYKFVTKKFISMAHENNVKVHAWTVDSKKTIQRLISLGVDGVITNDIQLALETRSKND